MTNEKLGIVGLGTMGAAMASNLLAAGHSVTAYNRTKEKLARLEGEGIRVATSPRELASRSEWIFTVVSDDAALESICNGDDGIFAGLRPDSILVDCGTTSIDLTESLVARARERGAHFVAAPMTGSKLGAERGTLTFMLGGPAEIVARGKPLFLAMGKHVVHVGERAALAQAAKICLNLSQAITLQGMLESFGLARRLDVPLDAMEELFEHSAARSGVGSFKAPYLRNEDFDPHFRLDLMHKDLALAMGEAGVRGLDLPAAEAVIATYRKAIAEGFGTEDFLATARILGRSLGVRWSDG